jgi:alternate signal-mediated exported protein
MNRSTKGALAAAAAGALLLGGAGSLAYWTGSQSVPGGTFTSGYLQLTDDTCASAPWKLDDGATYSIQRIVPGDTLTKTCTFSIDGVGDHMSVSLDTATPGWSATNALTADLSVASEFDGSVSGTSLGDPAVVTKSETITATITVSFDGGNNDGDAADVDNASNVPTAGLAAALTNITIVATQGHSA